MAARAIWKGSLVFGELVCPVALHAAASTSDRVSFHILNRRTGHRVHRVYIDADTGMPVEREDQVKGYETGSGKTVMLGPEEIASAVPDSDKVLHLEAFIPCADVNTLFFDRPYYLTPAEDAAETAFAVIRDGLAKRKVAAVVRAVLFRRVRSLLIRTDDGALVAHTLEYDREVRDADAAYKDIAAPKIDKEMLELAEHIIATKRGKFDPSRFEDRYDAALAELVKAKAVGEPLPAPKEPAVTPPTDLMQALRDSAKARKGGGAKAKGSPRKKKAETTPARRKAS
jgi:DNA end-binding protein Ku